METLIAIALSMVVTASMVVLMGNTMGTSKRIIHMTQLTDELRNVMSMMTRDVRRANYSARSIYCYGNSGCVEQADTRQTAGVSLAGTESGLTCLTFQLDRNNDGDASNDAKGGFRRVVVDEFGKTDPEGFGMIEMFIDNNAGEPGCAAQPGAGGWVAVTDPDIVDILSFTVDDKLNVETSILQDGGTSSFTQRQRQLRLAIEGELILEQRMGWAADGDKERNPMMLRREIADVILVRNDFIVLPPPSI